MQTCLVTGASGFLGRQLVQQLLARGLNVRMLVREPDMAFDHRAQIVIGQLSVTPDSYSVALHGVDTVFHLAAVAHTQADPELYRRINCEATVALASQAAVTGVQRFVFVSSTKAVRDPGVCKRDESWTEWPTDPYGYWKRVAEDRLLEESGIPHISINRPCLMYGAGVKGNLYAMLRAIDKGYFPPLPLAACAERSMVSAEDVASALILQAELSEANRRILIAADGEAYTAGQIYRAMREALGKPPARLALPLMLLKAAGYGGDLLQRIWPGCSLNTDAVERLTGPAAFSAGALRSLGWVPGTTFYESLPEIVQCYKAAA